VGCVYGKIGGNLNPRRNETQARCGMGGSMADKMATDGAEYAEQTFNHQSQAIHNGLYDFMLLLVMETASFRDEDARVADTR
jgi:hypothetical protein